VLGSQRVRFYTRLNVAYCLDGRMEVGGLRAWLAKETARRGLWRAAVIQELLQLLGVSHVPPPPRGGEVRGAGVTEP
jgi:hypothetical protein